MKYTVAIKVCILVTLLGLLWAFPINLDIHMSTNENEIDIQEVEFLMQETGTINGMSCKYDLWVKFSASHEWVWVKSINTCERFRNIAPQDVPYPDSILDLLKPNRKRILPTPEPYQDYDLDFDSIKFNTPPRRDIKST